MNHEKKKKESSSTSHRFESFLNTTGKIIALGLFAIIFQNTIMAAFMAVLQLILTLAFVATLVYQLCFSQKQWPQEFRYHFYNCLAAPMRAFFNNHVLKNLLYVCSLLFIIVAGVIDFGSHMINIDTKLKDKITNYLDALLPQKTTADYQQIKTDSENKRIEPSIGLMISYAIGVFFSTPFFIIWSATPELRPYIEKLPGCQFDEPAAHSINPKAVTFSNSNK